ncbi:protein phosphatase CheZ [Imbroritus primus]|uniref:protein phosphatase CheZ n=1 Tax=Imbroritus primus TaxID=3058603 RepID=UPI003D16058A
MEGHPVAIHPDAAAAAVPASAEPDLDTALDPAERMLQRVGHLTRLLRESIRELGLDREVEKAAHAIPDARDRLNYIAAMTEQAATRVLNAVELARPAQDALQAEAGALAGEWQRLQDRSLDDAALRALVQNTHAFLHAVPARTAATNQQLLEILMAQDFQDLTGQVIKKVLDMVQLIEQQLIAILLEHSQASGQPLEVTPGGLLNGPQVRPEDKPDVVASQDQVDDLLESLGF